MTALQLDPAVGPHSAAGRRHSASTVAPFSLPASGTCWRKSNTKKKQKKNVSLFPSNSRKAFPVEAAR